MPSIEDRKTDHLDLAARAAVGFRSKTTLLECVELVHCSLPELALEAIDTQVSVFGKRLRMPLLVAGMTGGTARAGSINRALARIAEEEGFAFGLGSQRPMLSNPEADATYAVRDVAPTTVLLGNIGAVQAVALDSASVGALAERVGADALCVHLNPAQELVQERGDRDFRGCLDALGRLRAELKLPVVAKETGAGISSAVATLLRTRGIEHVDVSGAGGTSWTGVEALRAGPARKALGEQLWDWGIPTAASLCAVADAGFTTRIATGGIQNGVDAARAIALGATLVGIARPVLQAFDREGEAGARAFLRQVEKELVAVMLLTGSRSLEELRRAPRLIGGRLAEWQRCWERAGGHR